MRQTLWEQMSAIENGTGSLAGLTLDAVLGTDKRQTSSALAPNRSQVNRTLLDIIRDEESHKDKKSWKAFRERLRLKRAGAAWTSSIQIPASDIPIQTTNNNNNSSSSRRHHQQQPQHHNSNNQRSFIARRNSVRFTTVSTHNPGESAQPEDFGDSVSSSRPMVARFGNPSRDMDDSGPNIHAVGDMRQLRSFRPQMSRHNSTRFPPPGSELDGKVEGGVAREGTRRLAVALAEERQLSAREAVAAQEAAEAAAAGEGEGDEEEGGNSGAGQPVRMSLMDLLEETDRQMGFEGSMYIDDYEGEEEGEYEEDNNNNNNNNNNNSNGIGGTEHTCCVCMVRHKGAAFIPCGHTFCRLCSRELWAQRGNCPLCNGFILEILHIF